MREGKDIKKIFVFISVVFIICDTATISHSESYWSKTYGGSGYDQASSVYETSDGGYVVAGRSDSFGDDNDDAWVLKLDSNGNISWQRTYDVSSVDRALSIQQTTDGGYIIFGSNLIKTDAYGNVEWGKNLGGYSVQQTTDGGYIATSFAYAIGTRETDVWILKLDSYANVSWQNTYGGSGTDIAKSIQQTSDGGYIVCGSTDSFGYGVGSDEPDAWVVKLDSNGIITWQKTYGDIYWNEADSIQQTPDGGYIMACGSCVLKLDSGGNITWQKKYGGTGYSSTSVKTVKHTSDGGYIVAGNVRTFYGSSDHLWVMKLDGNGNFSWQKDYGSNGFYNWAFDIEQTSNEGYIVAGFTTYYAAAGMWDYWVLKLDTNGDIPNCNISGTSNPIISDGSYETFDSNAVVQSSSDTIIDTNIFSQSTAAELSANCCYDSSDYDCDNILNEVDNCPENANTYQEDTDSDSRGDECDNCLETPNPEQTDTDEDGFGDACDNCPSDPENDGDADGVCADADNCPDIANTDQADTYPPGGNGIGDACDCEGNFNCAADSDVDGSDAALFKADFGRSVMQEPCTGESPCNGDFNCDGDADGTDATLFKSDFGRSSLQNPCPVCISGGAWCQYQ